MNHPLLINFPFCAVIGQERLKLALILTAIDPQIGGILISGPRGSAKSTLARGLADIGPYTQEHFVNLPLGTTEEKLIGSLDLNKVLKNGDIEFSPGLLHRAHNGILYIDEVNLLADHLVDLLLDVASSGVNVIERDGISHNHAAKFVLIGTMNPDEGELRPQLLDRFGLCVMLSEKLNKTQRAEIARRRLAFDDNPSAFVELFVQQQLRLSNDVQKAQTSLRTIEISDDQQSRVADMCEQANVEGLRADITIMRAARAHAAWQNRTEVSNSDIEQVADLVLVHRRQTSENHSHKSDNTHTTPMPQSQNITNNENRRDANQQQAQSGQSKAQGDWGELPPVAVAVGKTQTFVSKHDKKKV